MRPTLQPRLQRSFKHGDHRRFHSMIINVCEFDSLSLPALDHEAMCVNTTLLTHRKITDLQFHHSFRECPVHLDA